MCPIEIVSVSSPFSGVVFGVIVLRVSCRRRSPGKCGKCNDCNCCGLFWFEEDVGGFVQCWVFECEALLFDSNSGGMYLANKYTVIRVVRVIMFRIFVYRGYFIIYHSSRLFLNFPRLVMRDAKEDKRHVSFDNRVSPLCR